MTNRFVAIALPFLRVELVRAAAGSGVGEREPLAVVIARPGSVVVDETSLLGNTRLDVVSPEARALGVRPGQTIASARARYSELRVRVVHESAVRATLATLAEACLAFGATVAFDDGSDVVWVDVTGCAHLHGGEATLASRISSRVRSMGHSCRVAIAGGPRIAAACARFGAFGDRASRGGAPDSMIVPAGNDAEAMRVLPLHALPLDDRSIRWLAQVGLRRVGDLQTLPPRALGTRLGARASEIMALVRGEDSAPIVPHVPPEIIEEIVEPEYGVESTDALLFVAKALARKVSARLAGQWIAASAIELVLSLDRALVPEGFDPVSRVAMPLPVPLASEAELFAVLRARVESHELAAPARKITLRVTEKSPRPGTPLDMFRPESKAAAALPRLVAELVAEVGVDRVGTLEVGDAWIAEERSRLVPFRKLDDAHSTAPAPGGPLLSHAPEPVRLLPRALHLTSGHVLRHLQRTESIAWWRGASGSIEKRDFVSCWSEGGVGWAEIVTAGEGKQVWLRGWMT